MDGDGDTKNFLQSALRRHARFVERQLQTTSFENIERLDIVEQAFIDLDLAEFEHSIALVSFRNCIFERCQFPRSAECSRVEEAHAVHSSFIKSSFNGGLLVDFALYDCSLLRASFTGSVLRDVTFVRCDLRKSSFARSTLQRVTFIDCQLDGVSFLSPEVFDQVERRGPAGSNERLLVEAGDRLVPVIVDTFSGMTVITV